MLQKLRWPVLASLLTFHIVAFVGWQLFSWPAFVCLVIMYLATGIGVTGGYHRMLTHNSFKAVLPVRWTIVIAGLTAFQGTVVEWVALHRKHHQFSDQEDDPHSPHHGGFWWSHIFWTVKPLSREEKQTLFHRYAKDIIRDPFLRFVSRNEVYTSWFVISTLLIGAVGFLIGGWAMFLSFIAYGVFIRLILVYHVTWAVNSATHMWGYRNFETRDKSKNLWWVGLLAFGEGWHNNHHYDQNSAKHGYKWWEIDLTYMVIWALSKLGLVWDVKKIS